MAGNWMVRRFYAQDQDNVGIWSLQVITVGRSLHGLNTIGIKPDGTRYI